jgi:hypothetical protein
MIGEARVQTPKASVYMKQLCRHFGHRIPATFTDDEGQITFDAGVCTLEATPTELVLRVSAADSEATTRLQDVVERHLQRFAHRDPLAVSWTTLEVRG